MDAWLNLSLYEIVIRLVLSIVASGIIGFDREVKNRPAGLRTHVLVGVAACLLALIQEDIATDVTRLAMAYTGDQPFPVTSDRSRLIAQIVSGIGFLGAGTIIVTKQTVSGLTTAASLWATAALGIAFGMGFYPAAFITTGIILVTLAVLKFVIRTPERIQLEIGCDVAAGDTGPITEVLDRHHVKYTLARYQLLDTDESPHNTYVYQITLPRDLSGATLVRELLAVGPITRIKGHEL